MALLQTQFMKFDDAIRLGWSDDQGILRDKRDAILGRLRDQLDGLTFSNFNQGSYQIGTGVKPIDGDYDIDVGLSFNVDRGDWPDPVALKQRVEAGLSGLNVEIRRPCVTVRYQRRGEPLYHVDLNVYIPDPTTDGMYYLAVGKVGDAATLKEWRYTDPRALGTAIDNDYPDAEDRQQIRRVVRYLKRWKDESFSAEGLARPTGIALTASAIKWFSPKKMVDPVANRTHYKDLEALSSLVSSMVSHAYPRLIVQLPVPPHDDLFARMNDDQMEVFRAKLIALRDALDAALHDDGDDTASALVRKHLGGDFPVVGKTTSGGRSGAAIVASGAAG